MHCLTNSQRRLWPPAQETGLCDQPDYDSGLAAQPPTTPLWSVCQQDPEAHNLSQLLSHHPASGSLELEEYLQWMRAVLNEHLLCEDP